LEEEEQEEEGQEEPPLVVDLVGLVLQHLRRLGRVQV
jgi:hypothetical protein